MLPSARANIALAYGLCLLGALAWGWALWEMAHGSPSLFLCLVLGALIGAWLVFALVYIVCRG